ncbi:hypothetical protein, partial [Streptomyces sp. ICC1]|uniref:hypothetical protein n=1 Tax=Streptomyces sp. ICC1 TaxID=2099583 RepID=UPI0019550ADF
MLGTVFHHGEADGHVIRQLVAVGVPGPLDECDGGIHLRRDLYEDEVLVVVDPRGLEQLVQSARQRGTFDRQAVQLGVQGVGEGEYGAAGASVSVAGCGVARQIEVVGDGCCLYTS